MPVRCKDVYIVDGARTPFLKVRNKPGPFSASDLAVQAGRQLLARQPFAPHQLGEVVLGSAIAAPEEANIGRVVALRLGCGAAVTAWTVQRNCASGMQAIDSGVKDIMLGRHELVLAGGCDAMSHAPLLYNRAMVNWFAALNAAKTTRAKLKVVARLQATKLFTPVIALLQGLKDHTCNVDMGQTGEEVSYRFHITRTQMDEFAVSSHQRLHTAQRQQLLPEIMPLIDAAGQAYTQDDGLRPDSSVEKLAKLKPFFDKKFGLITPGNSSQITDGAALLLLASAAMVKKYQLPTLAKIVDVNWAGVDPRIMGLGPVHAVPPLLARHKLSLSDIDYWEINEAFAGQVLACLQAWQDAAFCQRELGLQSAFGTIASNKLNVDGGAIALGHPIGATGARLALHLAHVLQRQQSRYGVATLCIGGGQGGAMLLENTNITDKKE